MEVVHQFKVLETASRVLYLIPESGITLFKQRLKHFHLYHYLKDGRLLVHAIEGLTQTFPIPEFCGCKDAYGFLVPIVRFEEGNENDVI